MLRRLIGAHIQVETRLTDSEVRVRADRGQLEQVLVNLVVNARDAMPDGGTLTLATAVLELAAGDPRVDSWEVRPGAFVRLTVEDTGCGMEAETAARAFEPFFTTKEQGRGTGLGLASVYGIVEQCGGTIDVRSAPGAGTRCDVMLPMAAEPPSLARGDSGPQEAAAPGGTILVVEDEPAVRKLAVRILERDGYTVLAAENGVRALDELHARAGLPDLVLTDLVMPEMGGRELARRLRDRHPGLPVLFMSGYDDELGADTDGEPGLLAKPFTPVSLSHQVAELLRTAAA
jgi:two-component system cell cycle sensor histidine kinase/response regulator CckA